MEIGTALVPGGVPIGGNLIITTTGGRDNVSLHRVVVTGTTTIKTGAGADNLVIDSSAEFTGTFLADTGLGDDTLTIAQSGIPPFGARFAGKATLLAGAGNDTLNLGSVGVAFADARFPVAGSKIDGGLGLNSFDDELGQFAGIALGIGIVNWTDPT